MMGTRHPSGERFVPVRTCAGCGVRAEKKTLLRIVRRPDGSIVPDPRQTENGRGVYLCRASACLAKAQKRKSLQRTLRCAVPEGLFDILQKETERREAE